MAQGGPGERQIYAQAEGQNGDLGFGLPDAFYALGDALGTIRVEYGANENFRFCRSRPPDVYPRLPF